MSSQGLLADPMDQSRDSGVDPQFKNKKCSRVDLGSLEDNRNLKRLLSSFYEVASKQECFL